MGIVLVTIAIIPYVFTYLHSAFVSLRALGISIIKLLAYVHPITSVLATISSIQLYSYGCIILIIVSIIVYVAGITSATLNNKKDGY